MPQVAGRILVVAPRSSTLTTAVERLSRHGWKCVIVDRISDARETLRKNEYEIVLAAEYLTDGRGYDLTDVVAQRSCSLLVGVMLSDSYLWLPTVECGARTLGMRAVNPAMLEETMEDMLAHPEMAEPMRVLSEFPARPEFLKKQAIPLRRKAAAAY
jgi:DNA-binding NtrC family response regulator